MKIKTSRSGKLIQPKGNALGYIKYQTHTALKGQVKTKQHGTILIKNICTHWAELREAFSLL